MIPGAVPSIFTFDTRPSPKKRKSPTKRHTIIEESTESEFENDDIIDDCNYDELNLSHEAINDEPTIPDCCSDKEVEIARLNELVSNLQHENEFLTDEVDYYRKRLFNFENLSKDSK